MIFILMYFTNQVTMVYGHSGKMNQQILTDWDKLFDYDPYFNRIPPGFETNNK